MPVYEYQGKHYDLKETDPSAAKAKIMAYLGQAAPPAAKSSTPPDIPLGPGERKVEAPKEAESSLGEKIIGAGETALSMATGAIGSVAGPLAGVLESTPEKPAERAERIAEKFTYEPRTKAGKDYLENVVNSELMRMVQALPVVGGELTTMGRFSRIKPEEIEAKAQEISTAHKIPLEDVKKELKRQSSDLALQKAAAAREIPKDYKSNKVFSNLGAGELPKDFSQERKVFLDLMGEGKAPTVDPVTDASGKLQIEKFYQKYPNLKREPPIDYAQFQKGRGAISQISEASEKITKNVEAQSSPKELKELRGMIGDSVNNVRQRNRDTYSTVLKVNELTKTEAERENVSRALERPEYFKELSKSEQEATSLLRARFDDLGQRAKEAGVIKEVRENYLTHLLDFEGDKTAARQAVEHFLGGEGRISGAGRTTSKFGKERSYDTIEDLEAAGFKVKTKDASQIYKMYADSVEKAIIGKNLVNKLSETPVTATGKSALVKLGADRGVPYGWKTNSALPGYAIHPDLAPMMEQLFSSYDPGIVMRTVSAVNNTTKAMNVVASFFHAQNLFWSGFLSAPGVASKELLTGFKGVRSAVKAFREGGMGDEIDKFISSDLVLEAPATDVERQSLSHLGAVVDDLSHKLGIESSAEKYGKAVEKYTTELTQKVTWDYGHTGGKLLVAEHMFNKMKSAHPEIPEELLRKEVSRYVNNSFGGQNWARIAADSNSKVVQEITNPRSRAVLALALFAPDWTLSTVRTAIDAIPKSFAAKEGVKGFFSPKTSADLSRQYMFRTAVTTLAVFNAMNMITSGKPIWENKDPTRIEFPDGTSMQVAKHAMEPAEWVEHPEKTLANKMAFLPHAALLYWGEKEYPFGPELQDKSPMGKLGAIGAQALPFQVTAGVNAPEGEGIKRAMLATFGATMYGLTPEQKAQQRVIRARKRMEIMRKIANR